MCIAIVGTVYARDYLGMKPMIVRESDIEVEAQSIEDAEDSNRQVLRVLLNTHDTAGQFTMFSDVFPKKGGKVRAHSSNVAPNAYFASWTTTNGGIV